MPKHTTALSARLTALAISLCAGTALAQPAATDLSLQAGKWSTMTANVTSETVWYRLTLPLISASSNSALDIDNETSNLTPNQDTSLILFNAAGTVMASDTSDGSGELAQLTFGRGTRPAFGAGATASFAYNGRDGTLNAGTYYLASCAGTVLTTSSPFGQNRLTTSSNGALVTRVRYYPLFGVAPAATLLTPVAGGAWVSATNSITSTDGAGSVAWFAFDVPTLDSTSSLDIDLQGTTLAPVNDASLAFYRPGGNFEDLDLNDGPGLLPALTYGWGGRFGSGSGVRFNGRDGVTGGTIGIPAGRYYAAVVGGPISPEDVSNGWAMYAAGGSPNTGDVTLRVRMYSTGSPTLERPAPTDLSVQSGAGWATASASLGATDVAWFRFSTPADLSTSGGLDIDTVGTDLTPLNDAKLALYDNGGILVKVNNDAGPGQLAQLSFGAGNRRAVGDGEPFLGRDGAINASGGVWNATTYYLAVSGGNDASSGSIFSSIPGPTSINTGTVTARVRLWSSNAPSETPTAPGSIDMGTVGLSGSGTEATHTRTFPAASRADVQWLTFVTPQEASGSGAYLDIDTEGTDVGGSRGIFTLHDTDIALFADAGVLVARDDDSGSDFRSQLTFGGSTVRPAISIPANITPAMNRDGRHGSLPAGRYFLAVGTSVMTVGSAQFFVQNLDTTPLGGQRVLSIRTDMLAGPTPCGPSDVAGPNQSVGADGTLTADDIIVFLSWYFADDARANVGGPNQSTTPDNQLTADDIIVFLSRYFTGC
ncbi:MAG: hypothetical protein MUE97_00980 [Phycisphaerales bacterium]|jgi:hypothetical protein|nr:hypothetical protein [Phycisphaerales bacterium]